jgi:hypothetical protein
MQNGQKPTYSELYKLYEAERDIKNHLYYFITFKGLLNNYQAYYQCYANTINEKIKQDGVMFRIFLLADGLDSCINTVYKRQKIKVDYEIMSN